MPCFSPVFRWERGQRLNQILLDLQRPLLEKLIAAAPESSHTLLVNGDALILSDAPFENLPDVNIISFGLCVDPSPAFRVLMKKCGSGCPPLFTGGWMKWNRTILATD